jgi:hypothetical protein
MNLEGTMASARQLDNERNREELFIVNIAADPEHNIVQDMPTYVGGVLSCSVVNSGTISAQVVKIWVEDSQHKSAFVNVQGATSFIAENQKSGRLGEGQTATVTASGAPNPNDPQLRFWIVTARGNEFSLKVTGPPGADGSDGTRWYTGTQYTKLSPPPNDFIPIDPLTGNPADVNTGDFYVNTITGDLFQKQSSGEWLWKMKIAGTSGFATVAGGIGWIAMNFEIFEHWEFSSDQNNKDIHLIQPIANAYTINRLGSKSYLLFHVRMANVDPNHDILLTSDSSIYTLVANTGGGSVKYAEWKIATLDNGVLHCPPAHTVQLDRYLDPTQDPNWVDMYFYGEYPTNIQLPKLYPMNIEFFGTRVGQYGQNLPFVSLYFN